MFDIDSDYIGSRVSKYAEHAYDEIMTPLWFDRATGDLYDHLDSAFPTLPEKEEGQQYGVVTEAYILGFKACQKEVLQRLDEWAKNILYNMEEDIRFKEKEKEEEKDKDKDKEKEGNGENNKEENKG